MVKEISVDDQILWIDEKGIGPAEVAEVQKILYDGKTPSAYEVKREGEKPAAVFRACDVIKINDTAPGLLPLLKRLGAFEQNASPTPMLKTGLQALENLAQEAETTGKTPLVLEVKLPAEMAQLDPQKIIGTRFLSPDRQEIGLVGGVTDAGMARVIVPIGREEMVRGLINSGKLTDAIIKEEVKQ